MYVKLFLFSVSDLRFLIVHLKPKKGVKKDLDFFLWKIFLSWIAENIVSFRIHVWPFYLLILKCKQTSIKTNW